MPNTVNDNPTTINERETDLQVGDVILFHGLKGQEVVDKAIRREVVVIQINGKVCVRTMDLPETHISFVRISDLVQMLASGIVTLEGEG